MRRARFVLASAVVLAVSAVASCNCGPGVGSPCKQNLDCANGLFCDNGVCQKNSVGGGAGGNGGQGGAAAGGGGGTGNCTGLACQVVQCAAGGHTSLSGTVFAPNGTLPLYNAIVYVPNSAVAQFPQGVVCDKCGDPVSGDPIVQTATDVSGHFQLDDVPAGDNIPLVIQMGHWRRQLTLPSVPQCTNSALDPVVTRLPRNKSEGDIPQMAIVTGSADPFECLLRKIGLDDAEITAPTGTGRVHYYRNNGIDLSPPAPAGTSLYDSLDTLKKYEVVILACEGREIRKTAQETQNIIDFSNLGGRVFATHFSYVWVEYAQVPFPGTAAWRANSDAPDPTVYTLDTSFPKGNSFADWLLNVGASTTRGQLSIIQARRNVVAVDAGVAQRWFYSTAQQNVAHYTFNTPVAPLLPDGGAPDQCGRVLFSDFHVSANALSDAGTTFPISCQNSPLTAQEKALAFMLFDLSNCVQRDTLPPIN